MMDKILKPRIKTWDDSLGWQICQTQGGIKKTQVGDSNTGPNNTLGEYYSAGSIKPFERTIKSKNVDPFLEWPQPVRTTGMAPISKAVATGA